MKPFSIQIYLADGTPDGLRIVEKSNWTGQGVLCPRVLFQKRKARDEFAKAGVYILSGPGESTGLPRIYVGEAESIALRLQQHVSAKDFWTQVTFFVSKDKSLNKARVQYLESRLLELAVAAKRCEIDNGNTPTRPSLSEAERADVEIFLDEILLLLPVLG